MFPLKDLNPSQTTPYVTYGLLALNVAVFLWQILVQAAGGQEAYVAFVTRLGLVPAYLTSPTVWVELPFPPPLTLLTSMFVHAGLFHLLGNMLYLWVFADNVEDSMGHGRFAIFYLLCGLGAAASQVALMPNSTVPMVGASGAIAGVLGAYMLLFPRAQVLTLVFLFIFIRVMYLPAVLLLGVWFLMQVVSAAGGGAGVAWFAHIGGFLVGVLLIRGFVGRRRPPMVVVP